MGTLIYGDCRCGFKCNVSAGAGMLDFGTRDNFPHLCLSCRAAVSVDVRASIAACPNCGSAKVLPYGTPANEEARDERRRQQRAAVIQGDLGAYPESPIASCNVSGELFEIFSSKTYECPRCRAPTFSFQDVGSFD